MAGIITTVTTFVLENFDDEELKQIGSICKQVFLIFPHYCLGRGLMDMATEAGLNAVVGQFGEWRQFISAVKSIHRELNVSFQDWSPSEIGWTGTFWANISSACSSRGPSPSSPPSGSRPRSGGGCSRPGDCRLMVTRMTESGKETWMS